MDRELPVNYDQIIEEKRRGCTCLFSIYIRIYLGHEHASIQIDTFPKHKERLGKRIKKSTVYTSPLYIETRHMHRTIEISATEMGVVSSVVSVMYV